MVRGDPHRHEVPFERAVVLAKTGCDAHGWSPSHAKNQLPPSTRRRQSSSSKAISRWSVDPKADGESASAARRMSLAASHSSTFTGRTSTVISMASPVGPPAPSRPGHQFVDPGITGIDHVVFDVCRHDPVSQILDENHVRISSDGVVFGPIRVLDTAWVGLLGVIVGGCLRRCL
ncbi:MAG: hypothetical protein ACYC1D_09710 [Acidimicrobiales bacterium]